MRKATPWESRYSLSIETTGALGGIALGQGTRLLGTECFTKPRQHAVEFLPAVARLCASHSVGASDIGVVFVSSGPGSFTGLRIGVTAARMLALAHGTAVVSVPTLSVIAQNAAMFPVPPATVAVLLDAKRGNVYAAAFSRAGNVYQPITEPAEVDPLVFLESQDSCCAVMGEGVDYHRIAVESSRRPALPPETYPPRAEAVFALGVDRASRGLFEDAHTFIPCYVRPPEAEEKRRLREHQG